MHAAMTRRIGPINEVRAPSRYELEGARVSSRCSCLWCARVPYNQRTDCSGIPRLPDLHAVQYPARRVDRRPLRPGIPGPCRSIHHDARSASRSCGGRLQAVDGAPSVARGWPLACWLPAVRPPGRHGQCPDRFRSAVHDGGALCGSTLDVTSGIPPTTPSVVALRAVSETATPLTCWRPVSRPPSCPRAQTSQSLPASPIIETRLPALDNRCRTYLARPRPRGDTRADLTAPRCCRAAGTSLPGSPAVRLADCHGRR